MELLYDTIPVTSEPTPSLAQFHHDQTKRLVIELPGRTLPWPYYSKS